MGKMKYPLCVFLAFAFCGGTASSSEMAGSSGHETPVAVSPLTDEDRLLPFSRAFLRTDDEGRGFLLVQGEALSVPQILSLSPWDLMELVQHLSGVSVPLSRMGNNDDITQAWRTKIASFAASADRHHPMAPEDLFDPALVLWDPGYIQNLNEWGQWSIRLGRRDIVQGDLESLSPLEVGQAVEVLTGRIYPTEFILEHLEAFRAQLSVVPRLSEASAVHH